MRRKRQHERGKKNTVTRGSAHIALEGRRSQDPNEQIAKDHDSPFSIFFNKTTNFQAKAKVYEPQCTRIDHRCSLIEFSNLPGEWRTHKIKDQKWKMQQDFGIAAIIYGVNIGGIGIRTRRLSEVYRVEICITESCHKSIGKDRISCI